MADWRKDPRAWDEYDRRHRQVIIVPVEHEEHEVEEADPATFDIDPTTVRPSRDWGSN